MAPSRRLRAPRFVVASLLAALPTTACLDSSSDPSPFGVDASLADAARTEASADGQDGASPDATTADSAATDGAPAPDGTSDAGLDAQAPAPDATTDAGLEGGGGGDAAADGAADGATPVATDIFVNAVAGNDGSPSGAQGAPFKTLTKAMSVATAGRVVWLEDGTWDAAVDPPLGAANAAPPCSGTGVVIPAGVAVRALHPGAATVTLTGSYALCTGGGAALSGFRIHRASGGGKGLAVTAGTVTLEGVALSGVASGYDYPMLTIAGGAKVTMTPGALTTYATDLGAAIAVAGAGTELVVRGGAFDDAERAIVARAAHLAVTGGAKLVLDGVRLERPVANRATGVLLGVYAEGGAVELRGATVVRGFAGAQGVFLGYGTTLLATDTADISENTWGIFASGFGTAGATTTVVLSGSARVRANTSGGIRGDYVNGHKLALTISGSASVLENGGAGIEYSAGTLAMTGGTVSGNAGRGISIATALTSLSVRNATVTGNALDGVYLQAFTGTADLGTAASPGNNTLRGNATGGQGSNLRVDRGGVTAVGNTWTPNVQGADAAGRVTSPDGGAVDIAAPASGANFGVTGAGNTLRVAGP